MDLESQLSQARAEIARIKREKEEVSSRCVGLFVQVSSRLRLGMFVDALLILTADCTSIRIDFQFDRDFLCAELSLQYCPQVVFVVVLVECLFCFVFCCCFVRFLFVFLYVSLC